MSWRREFEGPDGEALAVEARRDGDEIVVRVGAEEFRLPVAGTAVHRGLVRFELGGAPRQAIAVRAGNDLQVRLDGHTWQLPLRQGRRRSGGGGGAGDGRIVAPMTGTVLAVHVAPGDTVTADQTVAVLTAMKMEHKLTAGIDGTVAEVGASAGDAVEQGALLVRVE